MLIICGSLSSTDPARIAMLRVFDMRKVTHGVFEKLNLTNNSSKHVKLKSSDIADRQLFRLRVDCKIHHDYDVKWIGFRLVIESRGENVRAGRRYNINLINARSQMTDIASNLLNFHFCTGSDSYYFRLVRLR